MFVKKDETKISSRVVGVKCGVVYLGKLVSESIKGSTTMRYTNSHYVTLQCRSVTHCLK